MDMDVMFTPVIGELVKALVGKGVSKIEDDKQVSTLRMLLRERVRREARLNREILEDAKLDLKVRIQKLETAALEYVCSQAIPLAVLFNGELNEAKMAVFAGDSEKHKMHFLMLQTEADLVERLFHRIKLAQLRVNENVSPGDISYLKKLNMATRSAML